MRTIILFLLLTKLTERYSYRVSQIGGYYFDRQMECCYYFRIFDTINHVLFLYNYISIKSKYNEDMLLFI